MCGFSGFLSNLDFPIQAEQLLKEMSNTIVHRGPDDAGVWYDPDKGIGLSHRRLSIVDLSNAGRQPMSSADGRYVIAFNGEIYNHLSLRKEIESVQGAPHWRGRSDTETLLAGFETWGIQSTIERTIGMFAFAVWDRKESVLTLGRDRVGEKPLYYGWQGNVFLFGSELKALKIHPAFKGRIDRGAVCLLIQYNYIPTPYSIYQDIKKLNPGCLLRISHKQPEPQVSPYWSVIDVVISGTHEPFFGSEKEVVDELERLASNAVAQQMMADVPLGAFLSGGVDSSTVVALMQAQSSRPVKTFSIGFQEKSYNEAEHAKAVASHLGTEHTELYVTPEEAINIIPYLPSIYCEPFSDSSQIPTFLVSQLARQQVSVSLSGDAGDELFCGYNRYLITAKLWRLLSITPVLLRDFAAKGITSISPETWDFIAKITPGAGRFVNFGDKLHKGAEVLGSRSVDDLYLGLVSGCRNPAALVVGGRGAATLLRNNQQKLSNISNVQRMMALDLITYLPDDILVKLDRAAMGVSLETRVPLLDHRLIEFAWRLPLHMKLRNGQSKWPLRQLLYRYVPRELIDRPKTGFAIPLDRWLRGPLRSWAEALLNESRLRQEGIFEPEPIFKLWQEHLSGKRNLAYLLWNVLTFQAWQEAQ